MVGAVLLSGGDDAAAEGEGGGSPGVSLGASPAHVGMTLSGTF